MDVISLLAFAQAAFIGRQLQPQFFGAIADGFDVAIKSGSPNFQELHHLPGRKFKPVEANPLDVKWLGTQPNYFF